MVNIVRLGLIAPLVSLIVAASAQQTITYTVKSGDSLYTIAHRHGLRLPELLKVNNLRNPHDLQIGDKIKIPIKGGATSKKSVSQSGSPASGWAEVNKDRINVRSAPSTGAKRVTIADRWTKVKVLGRQGDWSRIRLQNGRTGWLLSRYLSPTKPPQPKQVAEVSKSRTQQAKSSAVRAARRNASRAEILASVSGEQPSAVRRALNYLGSRYRYGGSSSRGFDCSGFTSYIYRQHGINLPHNSAAQYRVGKPVSRSDLRPVDLVFFRTRGR
ncbi:MAG: NlpC/P60 family protein, partial [Fimbriimonadales bacterium]|nr:NlpC/P60 family protein [Fimbriimonadales bacterium]